MYKQWTLVPGPAALNKQWANRYISIPVLFLTNPWNENTVYLHFTLTNFIKCISLLHELYQL